MSVYLAHLVMTYSLVPCAFHISQSCQFYSHLMQLSLVIVYNSGLYSCIHNALKVAFLNYEISKISKL